MSMKDHVKLVAVLRIASSALGLLAALIVFVAVVGGGLISGDAEAIRITSVVGTVVAGFVGLLSLPGLLAGVGLLRHWAWARWLTVALAVLDLGAVPIGTILGIYAIWVFEPCC
jgi:hypothetical protein